MSKNDESAEETKRCKSYSTLSMNMVALISRDTLLHGQFVASGSLFEVDFDISSPTEN